MLFFLEGNLDFLSAKTISYLVYIVLCNHISVVTCVEVMAVLHVWISSRSSLEACGYCVLLYVFHRCNCGIFQGQNREALSLYFGISGLNISKCFTGKGYGLVFWGSAVSKPYSLASVCRTRACVQS